jgi:hypothetical protein
LKNEVILLILLHNLARFGPERSGKKLDIIIDILVFASGLPVLATVEPRDRHVKLLAFPKVQAKGRNDLFGASPTMIAVHEISHTPIPDFKPAWRLTDLLLNDDSPTTLIVLPA